MLKTLCVNHVCVCVCVRRVTSVGVCWSRQQVWYLSLDLISVSRYRQELCWFARAVERATASRQSQFLIHKLLTALYCTSARCPLAYFSVWQSLGLPLKLEGQLSKMITLCIKHSAVSNFSFPSSVFSFFCSASLFLSDPMGEEHHTWGTSRIFTLMVVVCIRFSLSHSLSVLTTHTHIFF